MKTKIYSSYNTVITGGGFLYEETVALMPIFQSQEHDVCLTHGEVWFLQACLLQPYKIAAKDEWHKVLPKEAQGMDCEEFANWSNIEADAYVLIEDNYLVCLNKSDFFIN